MQDACSHPRIHAALASLACSLLVLVLTACGSNSSASSPVTPPPTPPPAPAASISSIAVACNPTAITAGATAQCTATVLGTGSFSTTVNWSASSGAISPTGLYTAPSTQANVTATATSTEDATKTASATIAVEPPPSTITAVTAACTPASIASGATSQCTATVQGTGAYTSSVSWSASAGTISASGLFTAATAAATVTITAASTQNPAITGKTSVDVGAPPPVSHHVVMVMEENQSYSSVVGNTTAWPNLNQLIATGALPTNYYANSHPSIGNYFMLTTGQLLTTDDNSTTVWNVDSIARRMLAAHVPFRVYAEGIPQGYTDGNTGLYLVRHNPFALLADVAGNPQVANQVIQPFTQFAADLANGNLPAFSFIVPNIDDDAHTGTPQQADTWLQSQVVLPLSQQAAFQFGGDGLLIVDFDESFDTDLANGGGHVSPVFWGPIVKPGYTQASATLYQHQSMMLTVMDLLGLPNAPAAAASALPMFEFFQ